MAALPPDTIQVKRKRGTDEGPVDFLRLERSKRYRSLSGDAGWVYQRKRVAAERTKLSINSSAPATPTIQTTREGDEKHVLKRLHKTQASAPDDTTAPAAAPTTLEPPAPTALSHATTERIRRFHLSRPNSPQPTAGVSKKRTAPAVFIERGAKKQRETLKAIIQECSVIPTETPRVSGDSPAERPSPPEPEESAPAAAQEHIPVKLKRPGARSRTTPAGTTPALPSSMRDQGTNMDALARAMDDWTLAEIAKNLDRMQEQSTKSKYSPATSRFKPKAPKQRYFERHPEVLAEKEREQPAQQAVASAGEMDVDIADSTDDEDYVMETYERVPAELLKDETVPAHRVGLLVFDTEPDMVEFFYGNESDSEDEFPEDEDDENAENYYAADYPDEDLDWDDEFDRNAYHYTNQNASDMEEFDERDFADDVWERSDTAVGVPGGQD
ncbi:hypothetical protein N0V88_002048 [Collariella sp. IMI 366227]|nr:hypothetical protein N0V88_002048 [Collariella sp. IMI 366227]